MADYATENNMTEDETVGVLYMTMNTTSSCVPRTEGEKQAMADKLSGAFDNRTYEVDYVTTMEDAYNGASAMIAGHPENQILAGYGRFRAGRSGRCFRH